MKPFDLEKALAGEPVMLRDHTKAYVKYEITDNSLKFLLSTDQLHGYYVETEGNVCGFLSWDKNGVYLYQSNHPIESDEDIIGMWEEPRPRVKLDLPCPLKKWQPDCYFIDEFLTAQKTTAKQENTLTKVFEEVSYYFATKEDADEWINAIKQSKR